MLIIVNRSTFQATFRQFVGFCSYFQWFMWLNRFMGVDTSKKVQNWIKTNIFTISVKIGVKTWYQTPFLASHLAKYRREHSKIRVTSTIKRYISSISPFSVTFHAFFSSYRDDLSRIPALMCELYPVVGGEMSANNKNDVNILTLQAETHNKMRDNAFAITHKTHTRSHLSNYLP